MNQISHLRAVNPQAGKFQSTDFPVESPHLTDSPRGNPLLTVNIPGNSLLTGAQLSMIELGVCLIFHLLKQCQVKFTSKTTFIYCMILCCNNYWCWLSSCKNFNVVHYSKSTYDINTKLWILAHYDKVQLPDKGHNSESYSFRVMLLF